MSKTKKKSFIVVPRSEKAMRDGVDVGGKHFDFNGKTEIHIDDSAIADDIHKTSGLKGSKDVWVEQDERVESWMRDDKGTHNYFFGQNEKVAKEYDRIFGHRPRFLVVGDSPAARELAHYCNGRRMTSDEFSVAAVERNAPDYIITFATKVIIPEELLERYKCINIHPAPLPEYAGLHCSDWAIRNGEKKYGATAHWTTRKIDAGDVIYKSEFKITTDNPTLLFTQAVMDGLKLGKKLVDALKNEEQLPRIKQDMKKRKLYTNKMFEEQMEVQNA